jgi:hypothetical protein
MNTETVTISAAALKANNLASWLLFVYTVDPAEFKAAFAKIGIRVANKDDLGRLKVIHDSAMDINGKVKNTKGIPIYFDVMKITKNVNLSKDEMSNALSKNLIKFVQ